VAHQVLNDLAAYRIAPEKVSKRRCQPAATRLRSELQCGVVSEHK
jgi:hypothetical protein